MRTGLIACLAAIFMLAACNTIQGAGQDIQSAGQGISNVAVKAKNKMSGQ